MLKLSNISKRYKSGYLALNNIDLVLPNSGFVALVGENGCGKTTLLNIIATIDKPTSGTITYNEIEYNRKSYRYIRGEIVSYVQQESVFSNYLNMYDNISLASSDGDLINAELEAYGIESKLNDYPYLLSGGQRQKCAFIRGRIKEFDILLVDEPTSNMDDKTEKDAYRVLKELSADKLVIVVSHNMQIVNEYADIIIRMDNAEIVELIDNTERPEMIIEQGAVCLPDSDQYRIEGDWPRIREVIKSEEQVLLKLYTPQSGESVERDYSYTEKENYKARSKPTSTVMRTAFKSILKKAVKPILSCLFVSFVLSFLGIILQLSNINPYQFEYDTFISNEFRVINFANYSGTRVYDYKPHFKFKDYRKLIEEYNANGNLMLDLDFTEFPYGYDEIYVSKVYGLSIINPNNTLKYVCGCAPEKNQIAITDYFADNISANEGYDSYEKIIENGITLNGYKFYVSGIIDTDYEKYLVNDFKSFMTTPPYQEWCHKRDNVYARFYVTEYYDADESSVMCMLPLNYGEHFADVCILEEADSLNLEYGFVYVNEELYALLDGKTEFKTHKRGYAVVGVKEDENSNPTVYVSEEQFEYIRSIENDFTSLVLYLEDYETYEFLGEYDLVHHTPHSVTLSKISDAVVIIKTHLELIILIILAVTVILSIVFWLDFISKDAFAIYYFLVGGYSGAQVYLFYLVKLIAKVIVEGIFGIITYMLIPNAINAIITSVAKISIVLLPNSITWFINGFMGYSVIMLVAVSLLALRSILINPIDIYMSAKNK